MIVEDIYLSFIKYVDIILKIIGFKNSIYSHGTEICSTKDFNNNSSIKCKRGFIQMKRSRLMKIYVSILSILLLLNGFMMLPLSAQEEKKYPYIMFAASSEDGAITINADNICINGQVATNGTIISSSNMNMNGTKTENAGEDMIFIFNSIDNQFFSNNNYNMYEENCSIEKQNINIDIPMEVLGEIYMDGNINLCTVIKAEKSISLNGEVKNTNDAIIFSKSGDIVIDGTNINLNGLIYAPHGNVKITAKNLNLNSIIIIADKIEISSPSVNANYSDTMSEFVGITSESETEQTTEDITTDNTEEITEESGNSKSDEKCIKLDTLIADFNNWGNYTDMDSDGLPDEVEEIIGSNKSFVDTDGDGLSDYFEFILLGTDSTMKDTDENKIEDGNEDFDNDGLTNYKEYIYSTIPWEKDSDDDNMSDGDEILIYHTNPLIKDTDDDGLTDGDEIMLGTAPNNPDTNGNEVPDGDERYEQTFVYEVEERACEIRKIMVEAEATGSIQTTTTVNNLMNKDIICSEVAGLVGNPFEIETTSDFDMAKLTFVVDVTRLGNTDFNNLLILWYDEKNGTFVELETEHNEDTGKISTQTTHFSKYMIVDSEMWFAAWMKDLGYREPYASNCTVLAIDCSKNMETSDPITVGQYSDAYATISKANLCQRFYAAVSFIHVMGPNDDACTITFNDYTDLNTSITDKKESLIRSLMFITNTGLKDLELVVQKSLFAISTSKKKYTSKNIILLTDGSSYVRDEVLDEAVEKNIKIYTVGLGNNVYESRLKHIAEYTGGEYYDAYTSDELVSIYSKLGFDQGVVDKTDSDGDGLYDILETGGIRTQNGKIMYTNPYSRDTDGDNIDDGVEIDPIPRKRYITRGDNTYVEYYFYMWTDPTKNDTDDDGYSDSDEKEQDSNGTYNDMEYYHWNKGFFSVNYPGDTGWEGNYIDGKTWISYGGAQTWFYGEPKWYSKLDGDYYLRHSGCGLISVSDVLLYMALTNNRYATELTATVQYEDFGYINYNSYYSYILEMEDKYLSILGPLGINGFSIASGVNKYSEDYNLGLNAVWGHDSDKILERIKEMLNNGIPVTLSIGPSSDSKIKLYDFDLYTENGPDFVESNHSDTNNHYVTVTGMVIDNIKKQTVLEVSTWGKIYYIKFEEYMDYISSSSNPVFSNILYIEK